MTLTTKEIEILYKLLKIKFGKRKKNEVFLFKRGEAAKIFYVLYSKGIISAIERLQDGLIKSLSKYGSIDINEDFKLVSAKRKQKFKMKQEEAFDEIRRLTDTETAKCCCKFDRSSIHTGLVLTGKQYLTGEIIDVLEKRKAFYANNQIIIVKKRRKHV